MSSAVIYLGGTIQPSERLLLYTLAADVAAAATEIKVDAVGGMFDGDKLGIGPGTKNQETVVIKANGLVPGDVQVIQMSVARGQTVLYVATVAGFANAPVVLHGNGNTLLAVVQSVADNTATKTTITTAIAAGGTSVRVGSAAAATFKVGDRILIVEGDRSVERAGAEGCGRHDRSPGADHDRRRRRRDADRLRATATRGLRR